MNQRDELTYRHLNQLAFRSGVDFDEILIDDFRKGIIQESKLGCNYELAATIASENLNKDPDYYASFVDKLRRPKIFGMAIFDWALTVVGILIILAIFSLQGLAAILASVGIVAAGVATHKFLEVDTQFGYYLGLNPRLR